MAKTDWEYKGKKIKKLSDIISDYPDALGFIYRFVLYDKDGNIKHVYIGRKNLFSITNPKITKVQYERLKKAGGKVKRTRNKTGTGYTYRKNNIKESNWKSYVSSNKYIKDNKNKYKIYREILLFCKSELELKYYEAKYIICSGALEDPLSLNNGVSLRMFGQKLIE